MLGLSQAELAKKTGLSAPGLQLIESGKSDPKASSLVAIRPGVRLIRNAKGAEQISWQIDALEDKISSMPAPTEPSPEAGMNIKRKAVAKNDLTKLKNRRARITP
jgi:DNA-binding XRE family transcriptional regulator